MSTWRDHVLKEFTPEVARLTLVADPDGLLLEEGVLEALRERGFELIPFDDPVAFRYAYETRFRGHWDCGQHTELVVVLRSPSSDLEALPYDLLQAGRRLSFNLGDLFPTLSYPVVAALDRGDLDLLYQAQQHHPPGRLGDNATKEYALRHLFEIAPELIKEPADLLHVLLRRHYRGQRIPALLDDRFIEVLRQSGRFEDWPLETIVPDREAFFAFLQERWPAFLDGMAAEGSQEKRRAYGLQLPGPRDLPFDHDNVRVYLDNLFLEGMLHAIPHGAASRLSTSWVAVGVLSDSELDCPRRLNGLIDVVEAMVPAEGCRHAEWLHFALRWAELIALEMETEAAPTEERIRGIRERVDQEFLRWVQKRYASLINLPPAPPVMLHHLPRFLSRTIAASPEAKVALLVLDGLALDQWIALREVLASQRSELVLREGAIFAWAPTTTAVSRQATFAGKPPMYFPLSIHSTEKESLLWSQFWVGQGLAPREVAYAKGLGDGGLEQVAEIFSQPRTRVVGLVIDKVDKIMHGMELGTAGMHNQVRQWARHGYVAALIDLLLDHGFGVYLTSDHGNVEAEGCGRPAEGAVADLRGERVRVYSDASLRAGVKARFPQAIEWPAVGLPEDFLPLFAPNRRAFVREQERVVGHGGISIEELIVPLVYIEPRPK